MQLSTRSRYAVMAMAELACCERRASGCRTTLSQIAEAQQLSLCYLEQLFGCLKKAGLVGAVRGPGGGYRLAQPADDIAIVTIIEAVDENLRIPRCDVPESGCLQSASGERAMCKTHDLWTELGSQIQFFLQAITLADVVEGRVKGRAMRVAESHAPEFAAE